MVRLGIDYGTTNTVAVRSDRGHYPVVPHMIQTAAGVISKEIFPSLVLRDKGDGSLLFGWEAQRALSRPGAEERFQVIRSLKRLIRDYAEGTDLGRDLVPAGFDPEEILTGFARALASSIRSSGMIGADEALEACITWPANANGAQRYLTRRCFRQGGFDVIDTLNEPTAAAIEFADRVAGGNRIASRRLSKSLAVFDLGGGTFDVSLVTISGDRFSVVDVAGIERLGGDDFDEILAGLFLRKLKIDMKSLPPFQRELILLQACQQKESISSGSVKTLVMNPGDLGLKGRTVTVSVDAFYKEVARLLGPAVEKLKGMLKGIRAKQAGISATKLDAIYLVGGSSKLPLVLDMVSRAFPHVHPIVSDKPFTSTAMGAAIRSTEQVKLQDILARTFGVLRLMDHGRREIFAPIFPAGARVPQRGATPLKETVAYGPYHNIGHLRFLECAALDEKGLPAEGVRHWSDILFPYDPDIPVGRDLDPREISERQDLLHTRITETYTCDSDGVITVHMRREADGQGRAFEIFMS